MHPQNVPSNELKISQGLTPSLVKNFKIMRCATYKGTSYSHMAALSTNQASSPSLIHRPSTPPNSSIYLGTACYTPVHRTIIVLKDRATHRVAKRITPSLSLLKGPSLKIRKRTTLTQRFGKLFMAVLTLLT